MGDVRQGVPPGGGVASAAELTSDPVPVLCVFADLDPFDAFPRGQAGQGQRTLCVTAESPEGTN